MAEVLPPSTVDAASDFAGVAAMINSASPEALYLRAAALDRAAERLEEVLTRFRNVSRQISDEWAGLSAGSYSAAAEEIAHGTDRVLAAMTAPSWGAQLRAAGDALALGQARMRQLQAQRDQYAAAVTPTTPAAPGAEEQFVAAARQILQGVSASYQQAGAAISPLPGASQAGDGTPAGDASEAAPRGGGQDTTAAAGGSTGAGPAGAAFGAPGGAPAAPVSAVTGGTAGPAEAGNLQAAGLQVPGQEVPGHQVAGQQVPAGGPVVGPGFTVPGAGAESASPATTTGATTPVSPVAATSAGVVGGPAPSGGAVGSGYAASTGGLSPFAMGAPAVAGVLGQPPVRGTAAGPAVARRAAAGAEPVSGELQSAAMPFAAGPAVLGRSVGAPAAAGAATSRNASEESSRRAAAQERPTTTASPEQEVGTVGLMAGATLPAPSPPAFAQATASAGGTSSGLSGGGAGLSGGSLPGGSLPGGSLPGGAPAGGPASAGALPGGLSTSGGGAPLPLPDLRSVAGASDAGRFAPSASLPGSIPGPGPGPGSGSGSMSGPGPVSWPGSGSVSPPGSAGAPPVRPLVTDLSAVTTPPPALPVTGSAASGRAPVTDPFGAGGNPMGHPMMPMGGMGMGPQDTEREIDRQYDVAFTADDDAWGAQDGVPAALGRPGRR